MKPSLPDDEASVSRVNGGEAPCPRDVAMADNDFTIQYGL